MLLEVLTSGETSRLKLGMTMLLVFYGHHTNDNARADLRPLGRELELGPS